MVSQGILTSERVGMIPVFTTPAGSCLTGENWQRAGIKVASFHLTALLMKPGIDFLKTLPNLAAYVGWHEQLVLNASLPIRGTDGLYALRSQFDGCRTHYSVEQILALIAQLQPNIVILPEGVQQNKEALWHALPATIFPFLPVTDVPESPGTRPYGIYFPYETHVSSSSELLHKLAPYKDTPSYISGDLTLPAMLELIKNGVSLVESDLPAREACLGHVYCEGGVISLQDSAMSM